MKNTRAWVVVALTKSTEENMSKKSLNVRIMPWEKRLFKCLKYLRIKLKRTFCNYKQS